MFVSINEGIFRFFAVSSIELVCLRMRGKGQDPLQEIRSDIWWPLVGRGLSNILPKYTLLGTNILLMEEILHQLIGSLSHNLRVFYIPAGAGFLPSTVFPFKGTFEDDFPFPQVGYASFFGGYPFTTRVICKHVLPLYFFSKGSSIL